MRDFTGDFSSWEEAYTFDSLESREPEDIRAQNKGMLFRQKASCKKLGSE